MTDPGQTSPDMAVSHVSHPGPNTADVPILPDYSSILTSGRERSGMRHQLAWLQDLILRQRNEYLDVHGRLTGTTRSS